MASNIKFKRSAVQNRVPTTAQLDLGELALNTYDGKLYTEINTGSAAVVEIGSKLSSLVVDGDNGGGGGDVVFHGTTAGRDLTWDYSDDSLNFADNVKAKFGNSNDLSIYHNGSNNHIDSNNGKILHLQANNLKLITNDFDLINTSNSKTLISAINDNQVDLYHNGNIRVTTTDDGADIGGTGSLKIPVGTTAQRSSSPTSGDLRYNTTTGGFEGYSGNGWGELGGGGIGIGSTSTNPSSGVVGNRIGVGFTDINIVGTGVSVTGYGTTIVIDFNDFKPGSFSRSIHNYTATAGQTTFTGLNYNNSTKQIAVYLNGARLSEDTYTATSGTTVVLDVGASVGDEVEIINIHINSDVDRKVNNYTATAGQTTFTGLSYNSSTELDVYLNGIRLASDDYTATSGNTVVLAVGASVNDIVDIVSTGDGVSFRSTADASGDKFTLTNVGIGTDITPDKLNVRGNVNVVGVLTATTLHGDGSNLTNTGSTLSEPSSGTQRLVTTSLTTGTMTSSGTGSELTFDYANNLLKLTDSTKISLGTGGDMFLFHNGTNSYVQDAGTGVLFLDCSETNITKFGSNHNMAKFIGGGAVELYHNNSKKFETTSTGATVTGTLVADGLTLYDNEKLLIGNNTDIEVFHDGTNSIFQSDTGDLQINSGNSAGNVEINLINNVAANTRVASAKFIKQGAVELYHNGSKKFETTSTGASVTGNLAVSGVLTYDDVTSVDSVGIITARQGVRVTADGSSSSNYISVGAGQDLQLYHDGSNSYVNNTGTGVLILQGNGSSDVSVRAVSGESGVVVKPNGGASLVELYYDNTLRLQTGSAHVNQYGIFNSYGTGNGEIRIHPAANHVYTSVKFYTNAGASNASILCHAGSTIFLNTTSQIVSVVSGTEISELTSTGFNPRTASTAAALGTSSKRWDNVYADAANIAGNITVSGTVDGRDVATDGTKLDGIEASATADQTASEILTLIKTVDGSGSGLDADSLDGLGSTAFLRANAADTASGQITLTTTQQYPLVINSSHNGKIVLRGSTNPYMRWEEGTTEKAYIQWNASGFLGIYNQEDSSSLRIKDSIDFSTDGTNYHTVWHAGNDGSGSGLDADTLDGVQGSSFLRSDANDTASGAINFTNTSLQLSGHYFHDFYSGSTNYIHLFSTTHSGNASVTNIRAYNGSGSDTLQITGGSATGIKWRGYTVWTAENDGSGSTLDADLWDGNQFASYLNQAVLTSSTVNFARVNVTGSHGINNDGWFRNTTSGEGLYNNATTQHFYSDDDDYWNVAGGGSANGIRFRDDHAGNIRGYVYANNSNQIGFLQQGGSWTLRTETTGITKLGANGYKIRDGNVQNNLYINSGTTGSVGISMFNSNDEWRFQLYGSSTAYGFLDANWNSWDIKKAPSGIFEVDEGSGLQRVWNAGNDGSGSGLDADTLDGTHGGAMIRSGAQNSVSGWHISGYRNGSGTSPHIYMSHSSGYGMHINTYNTNGGVYALELHNNTKVLFQVYNDGSTIVGGTMRPGANNSYDLGTTSARWRNVYTQDLQLSNEAKKDEGGNDVDGTWGDWTLQEGESDVYMINNRSGKKFRIKMEEVS